MDLHRTRPQGWPAPSLGSVGDPYDNAVAEAFWGRLQTELLDRHRWRTRVELANAIFEYIEGFYDRRHRHSALDWLSTAARVRYVGVGRCGSWPRRW
ncbi:transposase [Natronosporangium hydrolyticum]|uniref:Transposase n=1 Tax=Natronosporangium hydrolyticum TaxID=2811111 RepID=A0A895YHZ9_9ACTN|nr:transposase [Natronosporangium hydrolyticum]